MIFLKWFDVDRQKMVGQGKVFVNKNWKIQDLIPIIQEKMKWDNSVPVKLFEVSFLRERMDWTAADSSQEIKAGMIEVMKMKHTFLQNEIQDGDVIAFQVEKSEKE